MVTGGRVRSPSAKSERGEVGRERGAGTNRGLRVDCTGGGETPALAHLILSLLEGPREVLARRLVLQGLTLGNDHVCALSRLCVHLSELRAAHLALRDTHFLLTVCVHDFPARLCCYRFLLGRLRIRQSLSCIGSERFVRRSVRRGLRLPSKEGKRQSFKPITGRWHPTGALATTQATVARQRHAPARDGQSGWGPHRHELLCNLVRLPAVRQLLIAVRHRDGLEVHCPFAHTCESGSSSGAPSRLVEGRRSDPLSKVNIAQNVDDHLDRDRFQRVCPCLGFCELSSWTPQPPAAIFGDLKSKQAPSPRRRCCHKVGVHPGLPDAQAVQAVHPVAASVSPAQTRTGRDADWQRPWTLVSQRMHWFHRCLCCCSAASG